MRVAVDGWDRHKHEITKWIQDQCIKNGWTVGVAESCTGGRLAACFTHIPGSSNYFLGGVVAYSNEMKTRLLGVSKESLTLHGAVSEPVVRQMAQGALELMECNFTLAVSGIAGPGGGTLDKPVGTVWAAIGVRGKESVVWKLALSGTRDEIINKAVDSLMDRFAELLRK